MANHLLSIGINYAGTRNELAGCINDARDWNRMLSRHCASATLLLERAATRVGIISAVNAVLARLQSGDLAIITYSGHGTQIRDNDGDESDGMDEAICPHDLPQLIIDDEVQKLFSNRIAGSRVLWIPDCCHAHTNTRNINRRRRLPLDQLVDGLDADDIHKITSRARFQSIMQARGNADPVDVVAISACKSNQVSYDATFSGIANGAFTYYALQAYQRLASGGTIAEWYELIANSLPNRNYDQAPQLTANADTRAWMLPGYELAPIVLPPAVVVDSPVPVDGDDGPSIILPDGVTIGGRFFAPVGGWIEKR